MLGKCTAIVYSKSQMPGEENDLACLVSINVEDTVQVCQTVTLIPTQQEEHAFDNTSRQNDNN